MDNFVLQFDADRIHKEIKADLAAEQARQERLAREQSFGVTNVEETTETK
jgi:hypothetical protein